MVSVRNARSRLQACGVLRSSLSASVVVAAIAVFAAICGTAQRAGAEGGRQYEAGVREPAVAGRFYPADPEKLTRAIDGYLEDAVASAKEKPIAIIVPHAGYIYSGQICADAFAQAAAHDYDLIVLLGTNHTTAGFTGISIYPSGGYRTPLGTAMIDEDLAAELIAVDRDFTFERAVHTREHSIEVQVPFVQRVFPGAKILPAVIGTQDIDLCSRFGDALARVLRGRRALIVASSDLSHYPAYDDAKDVDQTTLDVIATMDAERVQATMWEQLDKDVPNLSTCACGAGPVLTVITAAKKLGATSARIISYANSGDASVGTRSRVVGYGAVSFVAAEPGQRGSVIPLKERGAETDEETTLSDSQRELLLSFARQTIRQFLATETTPLGRDFDPALEQRRGAFVTLKIDGDLRGCIGHMRDDSPLCWVVGNCAWQAAFNDPRFSPVTLDEMGDIEIEVSVLTPPRLVEGYGDILVGRDGVLIEKNGRTAVFLPSVAVEQGWDRDEMLDRLCVKAGLREDSWRNGARFYTFQATRFSESDHL
jgi:AmmeMemoRadiSam system protein B/AmmeMemoRadiSam system protein A